MKNKFIFSCMLILSIIAFAKENKTDKIIAISKINNGSYESYYLTRTGKKVGIDSLYMYDNGVDCENDGYIRFRDHKIDKVGFFDNDGNVAIPPIYSDASRVHNGMIFTISGKRIKDGEHTYSVGTEALVDIHGNTIIKDFPLNEDINLYSMAIEDANYSISPIRDYFKGENGKTYSFINYKKEFRYWLESVFKEELTKEKVKNHFFDKVSYWDDKYGWVLSPKKDLTKDMISDIAQKLKKVQMKNATYQVFLDDINSLIYQGKEFEPFYNNCYEQIVGKYPVADATFDGKNKGKSVQDHFEFLRTDKGYKLIGISIKSE
ncbi:MAG: hypothetical protein PHI02_04635 [Sulfurovaceae bacterium]|nr:hypothetical protein [Sulfurovaceae bacterium]